MFLVTQAQLAEALTEWDRRWRDDPDGFESTASQLLHGTPETYGDAAGPYLAEILREQSAERAIAARAALEDLARSTAAAWAATGALVR